MPGAFCGGVECCRPMDKRVDAMVNRLLLLVVHVPEIQAHMMKRYPAGSYERKAFEKLSAFVPDMDALAHRFLEVGTFGGELTADERQLFGDIVSAMQDAKAVMDEAGIDVQFTDLPPDFLGYK